MLNLAKRFFFLLTIKVLNFPKMNVFGEENISFSKLSARHFPPEFANSMMNPVSAVREALYSILPTADQVERSNTVQYQA